MDTDYCIRNTDTKYWYGVLVRHMGTDTEIAYVVILRDIDAEYCYRILTRHTDTDAEYSIRITDTEY